MSGSILWKQAFLQQRRDRNQFLPHPALARRIENLRRRIDAVEQRVQQRMLVAQVLHQFRRQAVWARSPTAGCQGTQGVADDSE